MNTISSSEMKILEAVLELEETEKKYRAMGIDEATIQRIHEGVMDKVKDAANKAGDMAKSAGQKATNLASDTMDFTGDLVNTAKDGAKSAINSIKPMIEKIIAWVKNMIAKIQSMLLSDTKFIGQYEELLKSKADSLSNVKITLPVLSDWKEFDLDDVMHLGVNAENVGKYNEIKTKAEEALNKLKQTKETTIGEVGGIMKIINSMKAFKDNQNKLNDMLNSLNSAVATKESDPKANQAFIGAAKAVCNYRLQSAILRHKAYKAAIIKAIGAARNAKPETTQAAVEVCNAQFNNMLMSVNEVMSEPLMGNINTMGVEDVNKASTATFPYSDGQPDKLTYDPDSYAQTVPSQDVTVAGTVGSSVFDGDPNHTTIAKGDPTEATSEMTLADIIDEGRLVKYVVDKLRSPAKGKKKASPKEDPKAAKKKAKTECGSNGAPKVKFESVYDPFMAESLVSY